MKKNDSLNMDIILADLFVLITVIEFFFDKNGTMAFWSIRYILPTIILAKGLIKVKFDIRLQKKFIIFLGLWFVCTIINYLYNGNPSLASIYVEICYIIVAYTLVKYPESWKYTEMMACMIHIWAFISIFVLRNIGSGASSNYMSVYYVVIFTILAYQKSEKGLEISMFHPIIAFVFSIFAQGRGGIVTLLALNILLVAFRKRNKKKMIISLIVLVSLCIFVLLAYKGVIPLGGIFERFREMGFNSNGRMRFWKAYIGECNDSFLNIMCGVNIQEHFSDYLYYIPEHLHNSFLTYYAMHGLIVFAVIFMLIFKFYLDNIKNKNIMILCYVTSFMIRAFTDIVFGNYIGDVIIYMLVIIVLCKGEHNGDKNVKRSSVDKKEE